MNVNVDLIECKECLSICYTPDGNKLNIHKTINNTRQHINCKSKKQIELYYEKWLGKNTLKGPLTKKNQKRWDILYNVLDDAMKNFKLIEIHNNIFISINKDTLKRVNSGCGQCGMVYDAFSFCGKIIEGNDGDNIKMESVNVHISQYNMMNCYCERNEGIIIKFLPLLEYHTDRGQFDQMYIGHLINNTF